MTGAHERRAREGRLGRGGGGGRGGRPDKGKLFSGQFRKNSGIQIFTGDLGLSLSMRMFLHKRTLLNSLQNSEFLNGSRHVPPLRGNA